MEEVWLWDYVTETTLTIEFYALVRCLYSKLHDQTFPQPPVQYLSYCLKSTRDASPAEYSQRATMPVAQEPLAHAIAVSSNPPHAARFRLRLCAIAFRHTAGSSCLSE